MPPERLELYWTIDPKTNRIWGLSNTDVSIDGRKVKIIYQIARETTFEPETPKDWWPPRPLVITYEEVISEGDRDNPPVVVAKKIESVSFMGMSPEVLMTIEEIHNRAKAFRALRVPRPEETGVDRPSPRSDLLATQEQLNLLENRINTVRGLLFTHGKPLPQRSDYQEWSEDEWRTPEEQQRFYWDEYQRNSDSLTIMADLEQPKSREPENGTKLLFIYGKSGKTEKMDLMIAFDFAGNFGLAMSFPEDHYTSSKRPLGEMTGEEHKIIDDCLEMHIKLASQ